MQKEVLSLSNAYSNRIDNLIDSSDKENVLSHYQTKNATSSRLPSTGINRVTDHSKIEEGATGKNGVAGHSERGEKIESVNGDMFKISFLDQRIIKCS